MAISKLALFAAGVSAIAISPHAAQRPLSTPAIGAFGGDFTCDLAPVLEPKGDGVRSAKDLFTSKKALETQVRRHQAIVRVPSISYDDFGDFDTDARWKPFDELHKVIRDTYPIVHKKAKLEIVNKYGLLYTVEGTDSSLKPNLMLAHQDVVPVADESTWTHPPFDAHYDGEWLWGRGSSDDKNSLTGLMSALEELLAQDSWKPRRTLIFAFGFDEECSGPRGAGELSKVLHKRYGDDGIATILDEGGLGMNRVGNTLFALPAVMEKGHIDIWFQLNVLGGHSSVPFPHTGIGIISEIVTKLEANPYPALLTKDVPSYAHMVCNARYAPNEQPEVAKMVHNDDLEGLAEYLVDYSPLSHFAIQTSQSVDMIQGGQKINAMPESISLGVNYRVAAQNTILEVQKNVVNYIQDVVDKYHLKVTAFEDDKDYQNSLVSNNATPKTSETVDYKGSLSITAREITQVSHITPSTGPVWDVLSGTLQHTFAFEGGNVVTAPECMTGNTDTRHYTKLTEHIFRFNPNKVNASENIHTIDERIRMDDHMDLVRFYYDYIRNLDAANL